MSQASGATSLELSKLNNEPRTYKGAATQDKNSGRILGSWIDDGDRDEELHTRCADCYREPFLVERVGMTWKPIYLFLFSLLFPPFARGFLRCTRLSPERELARFQLGREGLVGNGLNLEG
jgi:hypothetical protein